VAVTPSRTMLRGAGAGEPGRFPLAVLPTPLTHAPRLAAELGLAGQLLIKRDDLTGFAVAGNKARPLEVLLADACAAGAATLVTGGTVGSNFAAAAAAAAACAGLSAVLVYAGSAPAREHPNLAAARQWGARIVFTGDPGRDSVDSAIEETAARLRAAGERPYPIPRGGATARAAAGFHRAAAELAAQLPGGDRVALLIAVGSGGTLAGLLSGATALGLPWRLAGVSVSRPPAQASRRVLDLAAGCAAGLGTPPPAADRLELVDGRGPGHAIGSAEGQRAAGQALRGAGLVLDPVYSAKALAALPRVLGAGMADPDLTTVFWHTGGLLDAVAGWES
jgi:1-aminocyclopropane-1-carboxylate deaminase/D-cysteine desulfhydrase-like pyridoxal-dependent ACC family enzyme